MTRINGSIVTDLDNDSDNRSLHSQGYAIRHIETWHDTNQSFIVWNAPRIAEAELPY